MSDAAITALKALAHPLRFRILEALRLGERNVGEIEDQTGIGQPALSQQLGVLRKAGLVETRKDAKLVYYCLAQDQIEGLAASVFGLTRQGLPSAATTTPQRTPAPGVANFAKLS